MNPIASGTVLAALAAVAFGATTPVIQWASAEVGAVSTACLLYLGAVLATVPAARLDRHGEPPVRLAHLPRLLAIALLGAALAPVLLVWGLKRVSAVDASLLLNAEAVLTLLLGAAAYREPLGRRVLVAAALMFLAGAISLIGAERGGEAGLLGSLAVIAAVTAWATDNVLTRPLADLSPAAVVRAKGALGAVATAAIAFALGEPRPAWEPALVLLLCGMTGYGLSLRLYLLAQRRIGAARTGSVFAVAPFVGAALALAIERRAPGPATLVSALLFAIGVWLHLTEQHAHRHVHQAVEHDHAHRHDDSHHDHAHPEGYPAGEHSHPHRHTALEHEHQHGPDLHHLHVHPEGGPSHDE